MTFPVSGVEVALWVPPLVALVVSAFTSMGGVSGAFLLLPFQVSVLGFASPAVSSTNLVYNIVERRINAQSSGDGDEKVKIIYTPTNVDPPSEDVEPGDGNP